MKYLDSAFSQELLTTSGSERVEKLIDGAHQLFESGNHSDGFTYLKAAVELAEREELPESEAMALWHLALMNFRADNYAQAAEYASRGISHTASSGDEKGRYLFTALLGDTYYSMENYEASAELFRGLLESEELLQLNTKSLVYRRLAQLNFADAKSASAFWMKSLNIELEREDNNSTLEAVNGLLDNVSEEDKAESIPELIELGISLGLEASDAETLTGFLLRLLALEFDGEFPVYRDHFAVLRSLLEEFRYRDYTGKIKYLQSFILEGFEYQILADADDGLVGRLISRTNYLIRVMPEKAELFRGIRASLKGLLNS